MTDPSTFTKVFEDAEKAVAGIKNERLREIAFEKLVNHLLNGKPKKSDAVDDSDEEDEEIEVKKTKKKRRSAKKTTTDSSRKSTDGPKAWLRELADEGFFKEPKSSSDIREELETQSHHLRPTDLTKPLESLCHERLLRRKKVAPEEGKKAVLHWVNW
ncbi:MAG: hypothetical protein ABI663_17570 [Chryseolinea sp.]